ncbi:MAG: efflux RND transporter permease subunit [Desulfobacterales bacterium]
MDVSHWAAAHRRSILSLFMFFAVAGVLTAFHLPVSLFPRVNFPRIAINVDAGDRPADQMVIAVTREIEQAVRPIPGVASIRSTSTRGSAEISVNFVWGSDMGAALLQVESSINQILPSLPAGTAFTARRMDPTVFPMAAYSLTSDTLTQVDLRDIGEQQLVPLLSAINGIAQVNIMGGKTMEYRVEVDPVKLDAYGLAFTDVASALSATNVLQAVGRMEDHYKLYLAMSDTRIRNLKDIRNTILRSGEDGFVRLEDIARVYASEKPEWLKVSADGKQAVLVNVYQQPNANTVQIVKDVQARLTAYRHKLPKDIAIANWYDQSQLVTDSAASVRDAILIGVLLAALVLFAFLRSVKITLVAMLTVPAALAITVLLLYVLGDSFNIMTLGGMAAAVALIVDDAIVMIEHIVRRLREYKARESVIVLSIREAAIEFSKPLTGSSMATIIIFAPLAFLSGVTGAFFKALSLTMASSLAVSYLLAWLAVPLLSEHLLNRKDADREDSGPIFHRIQQGYQRLMQRLVRRPVFILLVIVPFILAAYFAYKQVGSGFMPHMDEGGFVLDFLSPPGTSLTETDRLVNLIEGILNANPAVETYSKRTGGGLGGSLHESNEGDFFVRLKTMPRPPIGQVMDEIRAEIEQKVPGLEIDLVLLMEDLIGDLTAVPQPIEVKLYGDNFNELMKVAPKVAGAIKGISGVVDVKNGIVLAGDALAIRVDRKKAALEGVDPANVTEQLQAWLSGVVTTQVQEGVKLVGVRVWTPGLVRGSVADLEKMQLRAPDGHLYPLKRIADIDTIIGQPQITRENLKRMIAVTGRISGRDMGSTIRDVKRTLAQQGLLPKTVYYELGGLYQQQQIAFRGLLAVFAAALGLVFLLLLFLYEEFAAAAAILAMPLLATGTVFIGLWITGIELNITAMMGMTMIVGIVTEVSIFYFSEYHDLVRQGLDKGQALVQAGVNRLRPITMTTLAAILALLPLALAMGQGSQMQQPLAVAIISGLLVQTPLVITVLPLVYKTLARIKGA